MNLPVNGATLLNAGFAAAMTGVGLMIAGLLLGLYAPIDSPAYRHRRALSLAGTAILALSAAAMALGAVVLFQGGRAPLS